MNRNVQRLTAQQGKALLLKWPQLPDMPEDMWRGRPERQEWWAEVQAKWRQAESETRKFVEQSLASDP